MAQFKGMEENKTLIAELETKKRLAIQKQYLKEVEAATQTLTQQTVSNEVAVLESKGKAAQAQKLQDKQSAEERFQQIKQTVEEARRANVSEKDIRKYVLSEQTRLFQEAKDKEKQITEETEEAKNRSISGSASDPRMDAETAFEGLQSGLSFSISTGGKKKRKGEKGDGSALRDAANRVGGLLPGEDPAAANLNNSVAQFKDTFSLGVAGAEAMKNILEITIISPDGNRTSVTAAPGKEASSNVNLGRFK